MKPTRVFAVLAVVSLLAGACVTRGFFPLFDDDSRIIDDRLVGRWLALDEGKPSKTRLAMERRVDDGKAFYLATLSEKGTTNVAVFRMVPLMLGGVEFVDVALEPIFKGREARENWEWMVPVHHYGKLEFKDGHLVVWLLKEKGLPAGTPKLSQTFTTETSPKSVTTTVDVVTANTRELQALVQKAPADAFTAIYDLVPEVSSKAPKRTDAVMMTPFQAPAPASCGCFAGTGAEPVSDGQRFYQELETADRKVLELHTATGTVTLQRALPKDVGDVSKRDHMKKGDVLKETFTGPAGLQVTATWTCTEVNKAPAADSAARAVRFDVRFTATSKKLQQTLVGQGYCGC
jgi:hypothetical protein